MADVLIPTLIVGDCTDQICVRVSRLWEFHDLSDDTKLLHADLVLIDEEGSSIHAQSYPAPYARFKALIKEGSVYNLSCFWVKNSTDKYKPVTNDLMISLSKWTTIEEVVQIPPAFPVFTYSLTPIEQLPSRLDYTEYFTDVIGIITSISNVITLRARGRQNDSFKRTVIIRSASNASVNVVLWGDRASSFPTEQIEKDGKTSPQVIIFVGTLVKKYAGILSLAGNPPCKWYINPDVSEAKALLSSTGGINQPIKWEEQTTPAKPAPAVEHKTVSKMIDLNPFKDKRTEFTVTVTIKKIDSSWWYNACAKCVKTAKPCGDLYKCAEGHIGKPVQRYKLTFIAGDETGDTNFIMFGKWVQRLTKRSVDTLIAENPQGFIPNKITNLLEKSFKFNVSLTENTTSSSILCFQVNAIVAGIEDTNTSLPITPTASHSSSLVISESAGSSMQRTPQKSASFPLPAQTGSTPSKSPIQNTDAQLTPQSHRCTNEDQLTPRKQQEGTFLSGTNAKNPTEISPETTHGDDDSILVMPTANPSGSKHPAANSATKTHKPPTKKRSRSSPNNKKTARKLVLDEEPANDEDDCIDDAAKPSSRSSPNNKNTAKKLLLDEDTANEEDVCIQDGNKPSVNTDD